MSSFAQEVQAGIPETLPAPQPFDPAISRAPRRPLPLAQAERRQALANALRYVPRHLHEELAPELAAELAERGRIYCYRYRPSYALRARPLAEYPARCPQAAALMLMIHNNLDPAVAQHPYELVTYGGNGAVFQNWAQYRLTMRYLSELTEQQTLVLYSGHPLGLFPSSPEAPRAIVTNGLMIPNYSSTEDYNRYNALGVTQYGQMTAGSYMYIGPQGIVHGTYITVLNAGRKFLGLAADQDLAGKVFVTSGLGGMSGAQAKAAVIAGAVCVVAELNPAALRKRHEQGWLMEYEDDLDRLLRRLERARRERQALSLGYLGNVVDLWERLASAGVAVDLGSDQTSLHNPYGGGYYPVGLSLDDSNLLLAADPPAFKERVQDSLRRQLAAIDVCAGRGMYFWDYGNAFLLECSRAGVADLRRPDGSFRYPSYVEDIMGPECFDLGFGPFRWVCTSGRPEDLAATDRIAAELLRQAQQAGEQQAAEGPPQPVAAAVDAGLAGASTALAAAAGRLRQLRDNQRWIEQAQANRLVVGSQARICYADRQGRIDLALAFNAAIAAGQVRGPIVLGRDHHDVSGTDSPYRETANIRDGSRFTADMAVHNVIGDACRGATWVSLHNGGGVGWGEVSNGGFGLLLDDTPDAARHAAAMLSWDVSNGLARRAWAGNEGAAWAASAAMAAEPGMRVTLPQRADAQLVAAAEQQAFGAQRPGSPRRVQGG